ncbi:MAG: SPOR domain-containing protein [Paracoccaceae bacterium]
MTLKSLILAGLASGALAGCELGTGGTKVATGPGDGTIASATSTRLVDHDVEAPKVFQTTDKALWDGRPSLGGVWVATPDAKDPERVIIRNPANGKFVIGALFRREADNPGPKLQISSDAADALGMLAGEPATLNVTALRREEDPAAAPDASKPLLDAAESVQTTPIDTVTSTAAAAIDKATGKPATAKPATGPAIPTVSSSPPPAKPSAKPATQIAAAVSPDTPAAPLPTASGGSVKIGIFSVEDNANRAVKTLAKAGITATVRKEISQGKPLWSVIATGNADTLVKIKAAGFADAYTLK